MFYDLVRFTDGFEAIREVSLQGQVLRYCDLDGNDVGRLYEAPHEIISEVTPVWALSDPVIPEPASYVPPVREITILAFRDRLTQDEKRLIYTTAKADIDIQIWIDDLNSVKDNIVDLDDPRILYGLTALLGEDRAKEIVDA